MNEIICPNCHKAFKVDEAGFADIIKQQAQEALAKSEALFQGLLQQAFNGELN